MASRCSITACRLYSRPRAHATTSAARSGSPDSEQDVHAPSGASGASAQLMIAGAASCKPLQAAERRRASRGKRHAAESSSTRLRRSACLPSRAGVSSCCPPARRAWICCRLRSQPASTTVRECRAKRKAQSAKRKAQSAKQRKAQSARQVVPPKKSRAGRRCARRWCRLRGKAGATASREPCAGACLSRSKLRTVQAHAAVAATAAAPRE